MLRYPLISLSTFFISSIQKPFVSKGEILETKIYVPLPPLYTPCLNTRGPVDQVHHTGMQPVLRIRISNHGSNFDRAQKYENRFGTDPLD